MNINISLSQHLICKLRNIFILLEGKISKRHFCPLWRPIIVILWILISADTYKLLFDNCKNISFQPEFHFDLQHTHLKLATQLLLLQQVYCIIITVTKLKKPEYLTKEKQVYFLISEYDDVTWKIGCSVQDSTVTFGQVQAQKLIYDRRRKFPSKLIFLRSN